MRATTSTRVPGAQSGLGARVGSRGALATGTEARPSYGSLSAHWDTGWRGVAGRWYSLGPVADARCCVSWDCPARSDLDR